jgi:hypothetical protein
VSVVEDEPAKKKLSVEEQRERASQWAKDNLKQGTPEKTVASTTSLKKTTSRASISESVHSVEKPKSRADSPEPAAEKRRSSQSKIKVMLKETKVSEVVAEEATKAQMQAAKAADSIDKEPRRSTRRTSKFDIEIPVAAVSPVSTKPFPKENGFSLSEAIVDLWAAGWDFFWSHYKTIIALILIGCISATVYHFKLYLYSATELTDIITTAGLQFRDVSITLFSGVFGAVSVLFLSSFIYKRRQRHSILVELLVDITKKLLVEFNKSKKGKNICPIEVLMEDSFDQLLNDEKVNRSLLVSLWPRVERAISQDKRISTIKEEVGGKMQRCWRFLDSKSYAEF